MLSEITEEYKISKEEYKTQVKTLRKYLYVLQKMLKEKDIGLLIVLEGPSAAGKGPIIEKIIENLDPRWFKVMQVLPRTKEEKKKHFLFRFWQNLPSRGNTLILNRSWNYRVLDLRVQKKISKKEAHLSLQQINEFETTLINNRYHIVKLWLHISRKEQKHRLKKMEKSLKYSWRIGKAQWKINRHYNEFIEAAEEMLEATTSDKLPWTIVTTKNKRYAHLKVLQTIVAAMENLLGSEYINRQIAMLKDS